MQPYSLNQSRGKVSGEIRNTRIVRCYRDIFIQVTKFGSMNIRDVLQVEENLLPHQKSILVLMIDFLILLQSLGLFAFQCSSVC